MFRNINSRNPLLPALILLVAVFILLLVLIGGAAMALPKPTPIPALPSDTLTPQPSATDTTTPTPTTTKTPRPTLTLRPTGTATVTPTNTPTTTETPVPAITPAKPAKFNDLYRLRDYTPDLANQIIELEQSYPPDTFPKLVDRQSKPFFDAYYYATIALREALLRLPNDPSAVRWRWDLAYDYALIDDPQAADSYAALVTSALNSRQATLNTLGDWFHAQEPRLTFNLYKMNTLPGYLSSQIVEVKGPGAAYFWLLESPNGFQAHVLASHFDFANQIQAGFITGNLTGQSLPSVVIFYSPAPDNYNIATPHVFSLAQVPPVELKFAPSLPFKVGTEYTNNWSIQDGVLTFTGTAFLPCPASIQRIYRWDGAQFVFGETTFQIHPSAELLSYCENDVSTASKFWGPQATISMMETLWTMWPPLENTQGQPYSLDAKDEWLYRLAVQYALAGERDQAVKRLNTIINTPTIPASAWVAPAKQFLEAYQTPDDLYKTCLVSSSCDPRQALMQLVSTIPAGEYSQATNYLARDGVTVSSTGYFDFENNGQQERWILVRHKPLDKLELWILVPTPQAIRALFVDTSDTSNPPLHYAEPVDAPPVVQFVLKQGFILERVPGTQEPYLVYVDVEFHPNTFTKDALANAERDLFAGNNPAAIASSLQQVLADPRFNCTNYRICDRFYYFLGLAYELAGDESSAINAYVEGWWEAKNSPFTAMARLKLAQYVKPTFTPMPTITGTAGTPSPTITGTPSTPTPTIIGTPPTATPTPTQTSTSETPYP